MAITPLQGRTKNPALTLLLFNVLWEVEYELVLQSTVWISSSPGLTFAARCPAAMPSWEMWRTKRKKKGIYVQLENASVFRLIGYQAILKRCAALSLPQLLCWFFLPCLWGLTAAQLLEVSTNFSVPRTGDFSQLQSFVLQLSIWQQNWTESPRL